MKILLTGGSGFIGGAIREYFQELKIPLEVFPREDYANLCTCRHIELGLEMLSDDSQKILNKISGFDIVIHLAAKAHDTKSTSVKNFEKLLAEYRRVNVDGTINLARLCLQAGVKRFIYISSIKVNGESTMLNEPFRRESTPNPVDPYGISKHEAELSLLAIANESELEVVIIRPPLVYGPGVKANLMSLIRLIKTNLPIPLGCFSKNFRSFVSLENLINLIHLTMEHRNAKNDIFLVSDGNDLSTVDLIREISLAMNKKCRLWPVPLVWLELLFAILGKSHKLNRLKESLQVNFDYTTAVLGWRPISSVKEGFKKLVKNV